MTDDPTPHIADYAVAPTSSRGRRHHEPHDSLRAGFALDRYRVVHCAAFRRLEYKTQVFVTHEGDHYRTRLTHSLEVAHLATELARALNANADLADVAALAHDLGHTPFGHAGEWALDARMQGYGGFEHNCQSLRVVEYLEHPYPPFRGLNLLAETRECLASHATQYDQPTHENIDGCRGQMPVEGQIANIADRLAFDGHDLEDALGAGLIGEKDLAEVRLWSDAIGPIRREHPDLPIPAIRRPVIDALIRRVMVDVVDHSRSAIRDLDPRSPDDVRAATQPVVAPSPTMQSDLAELEAFMLERVYRHPRVAEMDARAKQIVSEVFDVFAGEPILMPNRFANRVGEQGVRRVVCDYVAGMTDRFIEAEHQRLCGQTR